jgi:hypothetical protein
VIVGTIDHLGANVGDSRRRGCPAHRWLGLAGHKVRVLPRIARNGSIRLLSTVEKYSEAAALARASETSNTRQGFSEGHRDASGLG